MANPKVQKRMSPKSNQEQGSYIALKSKNEIYYQMASIFKAVTKDENEITHDIINKLISRSDSMVSLEGSI